MTRPRCAREEQLIPSVEAGGLDDMRITQLAEEYYVLSIKVKTRREWTYLATRRNPDEPRRFKRIEAAAAVAQKLFRARKITLLLQ